MNRFCVEASLSYPGEEVVFLDDVVLVDSHGEGVFDEFRNYSFSEMKDSDLLDDFVMASWEAIVTTNEDVEDMYLTLVDDEDVFIWTIMIAEINGELTYKLVDWRKDGKIFKFES